MDFVLLIKMFFYAVWTVMLKSYIGVVAELSQEFFHIGIDAKFPSPLVVSSVECRYKCISLCHVNDACAFVNYEDASGTCEQIGYFADLTREEPFIAQGWVIYSRMMALPMDMTGSVVWITGTDLGINNSRALDGDLSTIFSHGSCASSNAFWAVELPEAKYFSGVTIYYMTNCCINERVGKMSFLISMSRADSDAGISTQVGYYEGPPNGTNDNPLLIPFPARSFGKVLRIESGMDDILNLCEIRLREP